MTPLVQLRSASRELEATLAPAANLVCASLRHRGAELLGQRGGVEAYVEKSSTMGIPLLHPWANRLAAPAYRVSGTEVRFDPASPLIKLDPGGLPIHGVAPRRLRWEVEESEPEWLSARLRWEDEDLLAVFPFRHELVTRVWIGDDGLSYRTTLRPTGEQPVPVAFGYHPYLVLPGVPRTEWEIELPVTRRLDLDARGIPTGEVDVVEESPGPLRERTYDDGYVDVAPGAAFVLAGGGRRLAIVFGEGYPCAQVFAPADQELIAYEPMTAPTNALLTGDRLPLAEPGAEFSAGFRLEVSATG